MRKGMWLKEVDRLADRLGVSRRTVCRVLAEEMPEFGRLLNWAEAREFAEELAK